MLNSNHKFKPRGIEKWHAFAALISGDEQKDNALEKEILSFEFFDDYYDDISYIIQEAILDKSLVLIKYLIDNEYKEVDGIIKKIDEYQSLLILDKVSIPLSSLYSIEVISKR
jgi:hypothetical protein